MFACPYCFDEIPKDTLQCSHCRQFLVDDVLNLDFPALDKKKCVYCGKPVLAPAKFCRHCQRWIDEVDFAAGEVDPEDLV